MKTFVLRRLFISALVFIGILLFLFVLFEFQPGNPYLNFVKPGMSPEQIEMVLKDKGCYDPFYLKLLKWMGSFLRLDFGYSLQYGKSVASLIMERLPQTLLLTVPALLISLLLSVFIGRRAAFYEEGLLARFVELFSGIGISIPAFLIAVILIKLFAFDIPLFPISGTGALEGGVWTKLRYLVLPVMTLVFMQFSSMVRYVIGFMKSIKKEDFLRTYEGFGLTRYQAYKQVGFRAILPRLFTIVFMEIPYIFSGALITETIFVRPGIGKLNFDAVGFRDYPLIIGIVTIVAWSVLLSNLLSDLMNYYLDKRIGL